MLQSFMRTSPPAITTIMQHTITFTHEDKQTPSLQVPTNTIAG